MVQSLSSEKGTDKPVPLPQKRLVTTKEAAEATGLSEWQLRLGYRQGAYPALRIGRGGSSPRLRWNLTMLEAAIAKQMVGNETA